MSRGDSASGSRAQAVALRLCLGALWEEHIMYLDSLGFLLLQSVTSVIHFRSVTQSILFIDEIFAWPFDTARSFAKPPSLWPGLPTDTMLAQISFELPLLSSPSSAFGVEMNHRLLLCPTPPALRGFDYPYPGQKGSDCPVPNLKLVIPNYLVYSNNFILKYSPLHLSRVVWVER